MKTNPSLQYWKYTATIHCNGNRYSNMVGTAGVWICILEMTGLTMNIVWISTVCMCKYTGDSRILHDDKGKMKVTHIAVFALCLSEGLAIFRFAPLSLGGTTLQCSRHQWPLFPPPGPWRWAGTDRKRRGDLKGFTQSSVSPHIDVWECLGSALPDRGALAPVRCSPHTIPIPLPLDLDSLSPWPSRQSGVKG